MPSSTPASNLVVSALPNPETVAVSEQRESSYAQILKSTALIGGSSVINIIIGTVRTKAMALLLGPGGFGLAGMYISIANLTQSIAGMGISSSGVREIAAAVASEDHERVARAATMLRSTSVLLGVIGSILLIMLAKPLSTLSFGDTQHTAGIYLLSLSVFFQLISAGQGALIQGMRRISDLAKMGVIGAVCGTISSIVLVYLFRENGIVPSLIAVAAASLIASWCYSRHIATEKVSLTHYQVKQDLVALLKLGYAFMLSNLLMMGSAYAIRIIVLHKLSLEATGLYQAAWTLGGLYVGMILQAMGSDFYPRLAAIADDYHECNRLVNEQTRVSLLMAGPGIIATLTFAGLIISVFYATNFTPAVGVLRWICLGIAMRVISWPMGFIVMATGRQNLIVFCEVAWTVVHLCLAIICVNSYGLTGAGVAFFGSYVFHIVMTYIVVDRLTHFSWSVENKRLLCFYSSTIGVSMCGIYYLPNTLALILGVLLTILTTIYSVKTLVSLVQIQWIPRKLRQLLSY